MFASFMCIAGILVVLGTADGVQACASSPEPCLRGNAEEIPYLLSRHPSVTYSIATSDNLKYCDLYALKDGVWYISDYPMSNHVVPPDTCGTAHPIWMSGTHPSASEGAVNRTACVKTFFNDCEATYTVVAKNCTYYNVYCFPALPTGCPQRYCFDVDTSKSTTSKSTTSTAGTTTTSVHVNQTSPSSSRSTATQTASTPATSDPNTHGSSADKACDKREIYIIIAILVTVTTVSFAAILWLAIFIRRRSLPGEKKMTVSPKRIDVLPVHHPEKKNVIY